MKKYFKKAISPVVATALLLIVSVIATVGFQSWYNSYNSDLFSNIDSTSSEFNIDVEGIFDNTLYVNTGKNGLNITKIEVDGVDCNIEGYYTNLADFDISSCVPETSSSNIYNVRIITDSSVISRSIFKKENTPTQLNIFNFIGDYYIGSDLYSFRFLEIAENQFIFTGINETMFDDVLLAYRNNTFEDITKEVISTGVLPGNSKGFNFEGNYLIGLNNGSTNNVFLHNESNLDNIIENFELDNFFTYNNKNYFYGDNNSQGFYDFYIYNDSGLSTPNLGFNSNNVEMNPFLDFIEFNEEIYFLGSNSTVGEELFKLNDSGIYLTEELISGNNAVLLDPFVSFNIFSFTDNFLIFGSDHNWTIGYELYAYNGTNINLIEDLYVGAFNDGYSRSNFKRLNNEIFYVGNNGTSGNELFKTNGTHISLVEDIYIGTDDSDPNDFFVYNNELFFTATNSTIGRELFKTNGTSTELIANLNSNSSDSFSSVPFYSDESSRYTQYRDTLLISNFNNAIYQYDGNLMTKLTNPTIDSIFNISYVSGTVIYNNKAYFSIGNSSHHYLYGYDGNSLSEEYFYESPFSIFLYFIFYDNNIFLFANRG